MNFWKKHAKKESWPEDQNAKQEPKFEERRAEPEFERQPESESEEGEEAELEIVEIEIVEEPEREHEYEHEREHEPHPGRKHRPVEFIYLAELMTWRVKNSFGTGDPGPKPLMPPFSQWDLRVTEFVGTLTQPEATLLLLAIAPHVQPDLLDGALQAAMRQTGEFPQLGGIRPDGHNFRGFLPTGETALFLLGNDDYHWRMEARRLFAADHLFSRKKILWLEQLPPGEPVLSGKIIVSQDYIDSFVTGKPASPHFGANFPAKRIDEKRTRKGSLVLNAELTRQVDDIKDWVENNDTLLYHYGMEDRLKKGYRALFYGPPGTGKTLTAGILGNELSKDVYRIDISMVVSKYIGETEKNLELLFARAEDKGWVLFFDEADALFGKRTDVRDAHDKYANQEVSYLLQRIEDYDGLIILATNKKNNIDEAFVRRFNSVLKFPFPDARDRQEIWKKSLPNDVHFVRETAGGEVETLDNEKVLRLLRRYELSGANIMNVVHHASLKATQRVRDAGEASANDGSAEQALTLYLGDLLSGIKKEMTKESKPFVEIRLTDQMVINP
jgi:ATPase family associated with various cellular activities (AAA)